MSEELEKWQAQFEASVENEYKKQVHADGAHDLTHLRRVWRNCRTINEEDKLGVEPLVLLASAYFHDIVNVPKDSKERSQASRKAARLASSVLKSLEFPSEYLDEIEGAIRSHSFSAKIEAGTTAAKILQDADRLEALGALGIARVFYVAGQMNSKLFDPEDPWSERRDPDDRKYAIDHFTVKLLKIEDSMHTVSGRRIAKELSNKMRDFLYELKSELSGS